MDKDNDEFWIDEEMAKALLSENYEVFRHYFIDLKEGDPSDENIKKIALQIYEKYGHPEKFDNFVKRFQKLCKEKREERLKKSEECTQHSRDTQTEPPVYTVNEQEIYTWSPHRRVSVVPPFRRRRRSPVTFNVVDFLLQKRKSDEVFSFKLQLDEDVQEVLSNLQMTERKKMSLLADGVLRKIAEHIELLNQEYDYRILHVDYEQ